MKKMPILLLALITLLGVVSCEKLNRPALPKDYPTDNPVTPSTPLRFYVDFDSTTTADAQLNIRFKDSISNYPCFFPDPSITYTTGVSGTAMQGSATALIHYVNANDFASSTSFSLSIWIQATLAQKDHVNADGLLSLPSTLNFWSNICIFADHETSTSDSMPLKFHFADGTGDNWDFQFAGTGDIPHMYDGNWHQIAFTYDQAAQTGTLYIDGAPFATQSQEAIAFDGAATGFIIGGFQEMIGIYDTQANNTWQSGWQGGIDQVRLYNTALAASDVQALYNNKQ
jgi:hypothetical protein